MNLNISDIVVGENRRPLDGATVEKIIETARHVGLLQPVVVRFVDSVPHLVDGHHRLEAVKRLNCATIAYVELKGGDETAEMAELVANLARNELTTAQRDEHLRRIAELVEQHWGVMAHCEPKLSQRGRHGEGRPAGVTAIVAKLTGRSASTVKRALGKNGNAPRKLAAPKAPDPIAAYQTPARKLRDGWKGADRETREAFLRWLPVEAVRWSYAQLEAEDANG